MGMRNNRYRELSVARIGLWQITGSQPQALRVGSVQLEEALEKLD